MRNLLIASLLALVCLPALGEDHIKHNIIRAKWELWNKLDNDSIYGVGIGTGKDSTEILVVFANCSDVKLVRRIPEKFKGIKVSTVCTEPIKAEDIK